MELLPSSDPPFRPLNRGGRPRHEPTSQTRNMVRMCAGFGVPQEDIALALGLTRPTLKRHYSPEIEVGKAQTHIRLMSNLLEMSNMKNTVGLKATIFALTRRFGWSPYAGLAPAEMEPANREKQH